MILDQLLAITNFVLTAFLHIWPYLLVTIPLAVAVQLSGAARYIQRAFEGRPIPAIFLATAVGAFSPFCSCGVIPVVATLLIGGVPLAPVMAFWIASPSMDPETFFLSVATLGWELAIWRLAATLLLSLAAGLITHLAVQRGWLGRSILRTRPVTAAPGSSWTVLKQGWSRLKTNLAIAPALHFRVGSAPLAAEAACCGSTPAINRVESRPVAAGAGCGSRVAARRQPASDCGNSCGLKPPSFRQRLLDETWNATLMVAKFMALAFFLEALIVLYIPSEWIAGLVGRQNGWAILAAGLIGVPVYTSNIAALSLIGGLLAQGMNPGAALAFLIAGPTTTLPAMAAVWGLASRRVFVLYVSFSLVGAIVLGYAYGLVEWLLR